MLKEEVNRKRMELDRVTQQVISIFHIECYGNVVMQLSQAEADTQTCNHALVACRSQVSWALLGSYASDAYTQKID